MAFVFEQPHLHRDAIGTQGRGHAFGLFRWHHLVLQALKEQHRAADAIGVAQWRALFIDLPLFGPVTDESVEIARFETVGVLGHGREVADGIAAGSDAEHIGEAEGRQGGETAGTSPFDGDLIGMGSTRLDQRLGRCRTVAHIDNPPALIESRSVLPPEAGGSPVVHIDNAPAAGSPVLDAQLQAAAGHGGRPAVAFHQQGGSTTVAIHRWVVPGMGAFVAMAVEPDRFSHTDRLHRQGGVHGWCVVPQR